MLGKEVQEQVTREKNAGGVHQTTGDEFSCRLGTIKVNGEKDS